VGSAFRTASGFVDTAGITPSETASHTGKAQSTALARSVPLKIGYSLKKGRGPRLLFHWRAPQGRRPARCTEATGPTPFCTTHSSQPTVCPPNALAFNTRSVIKLGWVWSPVFGNGRRPSNVEQCPFLVVEGILVDPVEASVNKQKLGHVGPTKLGTDFTAVECPFHREEIRFRLLVAEGSFPGWVVVVVR
jgi:hypothetical protein